MQLWLVIGYVVCFALAATGGVLAAFSPGRLLSGLLTAAGALVGMALLRCLEEVVRRLPPPEA